MRTIVLAAIVLALAAAHAPAAITVEAYYRGGETEGKSPGDTWAFGPETQAVLDASGNGKSMRAAANSSAVAHAIPEIAGSVAYDGFLRPQHFPSLDSNLIFDGTGNPSAFQNWGVELWFRADTDTDSSFLAMLGHQDFGSGRGIGLLQDGAKVVAYYPGSGTSGNKDVQIDIGNGPGEVAVGEWAYMAVVNEDGVNTMFLNGQSVGTWNASPDMSLHNGNDPLEYWKLGFGFSNNTPFLGDIDELRVFSFESGQFQTSDLLIPEPATMGLLAVGGLGMLLKRKRS